MVTSSGRISGLKLDLSPPRNRRTQWICARFATLQNYSRNGNYGTIDLQKFQAFTRVEKWAWGDSGGDLRGKLIRD